MRFRILSLLLLLSIRLVAADPEFGVVENDRVPYKFTNNSRVVAIGDLHGDTEALFSILLARKLINKEGTWIGGNADLVLAGDFVGKNRSSTKEMMDTLLQLEASAKKGGGRVHTILGNADLLALKKFGFLENEPAYKEWLLKRNAIVQINDRIYTHAGLDIWAMENSVQAINSTLRSWLKYYFGEGERPPDNTRWVVKQKGINYFGRRVLGPLWTRAFKIFNSEKDSRPKGGIKRKQLREILESNDAKAMVIGHNPTPDTKIALKHPYYGDLVISIDTRNSDEIRGQLSSLEIKNGRVSRQYTERSASCPSLHERLGSGTASKR